MIHSVLSAAIASFRFITSDVGVQWVYLALAVLHLLLGFDRAFEHWLWRKGIVIEPPQRALILANWLCTIVFMFSVLINGANPRLSRAVIMPYSRLVWFMVAVSLACCVVLKSWRLIVVVYGLRRAAMTITEGENT